MALPLLRLPSMPEVHDHEPEVASRKVVHEYVSSGTSKQNIGMIITIAIIAVALIVFIVMQMR